MEKKVKKKSMMRTMMMMIYNKFKFINIDIF